MPIAKSTNDTTRNRFIELVTKYFHSNASSVQLSEPSFKCDGHTSTATLFGTVGSVEIRCGPAEYHAEIFIYTNGNVRWTLADLISNEHVRSWLLNNRPNSSGRSQLETEIDCAFKLLAYGLKGFPGFEWLYG